jgi:hypothetical protein
MTLTHGQSQTDVFLDPAPRDKTRLLENRSDCKFVWGWMNPAFEISIQTYHNTQDRRLSNSGRTDQAQGLIVVDSKMKSTKNFKRGYPPTPIDLSVDVKL